MALSFLSLINIPSLSHHMAPLYPKSKPYLKVAVVQLNYLRGESFALLPGERADALLHLDTNLQILKEGH